MKNIFMISKWWTDPNFEKFLLQAHVDASIGLKNGVPVQDVKEVAEDFAKKFLDSFNWENKMPSGNVEDDFGMAPS